MIPEVRTEQEFESILSKNLVTVVFFIKEDSDHSNELLGRIQLELIPNLREVNGVALIKIPLDTEVDFASLFNINEVPCTLVFYKGQKVSFYVQDRDNKLYKTDRFMGNDPKLPNKLFRFILHLFKRYKGEKDNHNS